jgi:hypothetical protein
MAKLVKNSDTQEKNIQIPYGRYCIDSFKLSIDIDKLESIDIPEKFILVSEDTGEEISHFKKSSIQLDYKNSSIYIGLFRRILRGMHYDKLMILFSSKVAGEYYFDGILKHHIIDVLEYIKTNGYIKYTNVSTIFKNLYTTDCDIKRDFKFDKSERENIAEYNKIQEERFQFENCEFRRYNNQKQGTGMQAFHRDRSTLAKPFLKFYDKTKEIMTKHPEFFATLPENIRDEVMNNFIYRFEFTMKNKKFFDKFGLSNRIEDVLEVSNDKWREIGKTFLQSLFQYRVKRVIDTSKLNYSERIHALQVYEQFFVHKYSVDKIRTMFLLQPNKDARFKANKLFDKIWQNVSDTEIVELSNKYESIQALDKIFGFV